MVIFEEKGPLVITVYWQLGVWNSSLLKCPITSDLKCVQSNRPSNTVPPLTIPIAFCSWTGGQQKEKEADHEREKRTYSKADTNFSTINNILGLMHLFLYLDVVSGSVKIVLRSAALDPIRRKKYYFNWKPFFFCVLFVECKWTTLILNIHSFLF